MLTVLIVGGGIAGLTTALALRRAGHAVHIYERSHFNNEIGAGIFVPPNASRPLLAWGFNPDRARLVKAKCTFRANGPTLSQFMEADLGIIESQYGAPWYLAHRVDLHEELRRLATGRGEEGEQPAGEPATVHLGSEVVRYDPETPSITLADGTVVKGDVVIAADGVHSLGVETILGRPNPALPQEGDNFCYRFLIPTADIASDPVSRFWTESDDGRVKLLIGDSKRVVSYPCRNNEVHNFACIFHNDDSSSIKKEDWHASVDKSKLLETFSDFHPSALAVLDKATEVKQWALLFRAPIPSWTKGKMTVAGDAAHPMLPHQGQGGAQGVEDGVALGIVLSGATAEQVPERLRLYERIRRSRASLIQIFSNAGQDEAYKIQEEASKFMPADIVPKGPREFYAFNFGYDVIRDAIQQTTELDPAFTLPKGFFQKEPGQGVYVSFTSAELSRI